MRVVATAGHVDHGKSTLVRALTGMEPDRWAEERRRGMTIDLGYAWTRLPSGQVLAFVDVPGHARFIGNMLAGLGPAPAVLFVVAADEGWRRQSAEHLAAVRGLGLRHALLAVTRSDLADPAPATAQAQEQLSAALGGPVPSVAVSAVTGAGLDALRAALDRLVERVDPPDPAAPARLWVDRSFTVRGSGTVVTGTLGEGTLAAGDVLDLAGRRVTVRALHSLGEPAATVPAPARVAVNLRGVERAEVRRGDVLLAPDGWWLTDELDASLDPPVDPLPGALTLHVGTAAVPARLRRLGAGAVRVRLGRRVPLRPGDRALLRDPAAQQVLAGLVVLDPDPPPLRRRGAAAARAAELADGPPGVAAQVRRRGAVRADDLRRRGCPPQPADGVLRVGEWLVDEAAWAGWRDRLVAAVHDRAGRDPLWPGLADEAAVGLLGLPDRALLAPLAAAGGLAHAAGRLRPPGGGPAFGDWLDRLAERLTGEPYAAPEQHELAALGAGRRELAAAAAAGRLLLLPGDVTLLPDGPARAMRVLAGLPQPFTASQARQALGTTRRVAIPLLEELDRRRWTRRLDGTHREVVR